METDFRKTVGPRSCVSDSLAPRLLSKTTQHNQRLTHSVSQETNKNRGRGKKKDEIDWNKKNNKEKAERLPVIGSAAAERECHRCNSGVTTQRKHGAGNVDLLCWGLLPFSHFCHSCFTPGNLHTQLLQTSMTTFKVAIKLELANQRLLKTVPAFQTDSYVLKK